jgi:hypothetical protein
MPRISKRARFIRDLEGIVAERLATRQLRSMVANRVDVALVTALKNAHAKRYLFRTSLYRKG